MLKLTTLLFFVVLCCFVVLAGSSWQSWMAELCPMPEERALIVGVAITLTFSIDAFANSQSSPPPPCSSPLCSIIVYLCDDGRATTDRNPIKSNDSRYCFVHLDCVFDLLCFVTSLHLPSRTSSPLQDWLQSRCGVCHRLHRFHWPLLATGSQNESRKAFALPQMMQVAWMSSAASRR